MGIRAQRPKAVERAGPTRRPAKLCWCDLYCDGRAVPPALAGIFSRKFLEIADGGGIVLLQNGGFSNGCITERCLHN
jgi:hypothetical protein